MTTDPRLRRIAWLLTRKAEGRYGLADISQRQHALQAAWLAEQHGCGAALIAASLLHDIGHLVHDLGEDPAGEGVDDRHEELGHAFLRDWFGPEVTEPVRLHVAAKRYLCGTEAAAFAALPGAAAAVQLRRFDDAAKARDLRTPPVGHFLPCVARCLTPRP